MKKLSLLVAFSLVAYGQRISGCEPVKFTDDQRNLDSALFSPAIALNSLSPDVISVVENVEIIQINIQILKRSLCELESNIGMYHALKRDAEEKLENAQKQFERNKSNDFAFEQIKVQSALVKTYTEKLKSLVTDFITQENELKRLYQL